MPSVKKNHNRKVLACFNKYRKYEILWKSYRCQTWIYPCFMQTNLNSFRYISQSVCFIFDDVCTIWQNSSRVTFDACHPTEICDLLLIINKKLQTLRRFSCFFFFLLCWVYFETTSHRFVISETRVQLQDHARGIHGGRSDTSRSLSLSTSVFLIRYNSTDLLVIIFA